MQKSRYISSRIGLHIALLAFAVQWVLLDLALRGLSPYRKDPRLLLTAIASVLSSFVVGNIFWRPVVRAALAGGVASLTVIDVVVYRHYHVPLDEQVIETALFAWSDVKPVAIAMLPGAALTIAVAGALEYGLLTFAARGAVLHRTRARAVVFAAGVLALLAGGELRDGTLEVRLAHAATLAWEPARAPEASGGAEVHVVPLASRRARLPNVLFVLTESVRADDYCSGYDPACKIAPRVASLLPKRVPLRGMRSVASYTAVSVSALLTGRSQLGPRGEILAAPTWFDFARATRAGERSVAPSVIYWSAQSERVFERKDLRSALDSFVTMETLLGHAVGDEDKMIDRGVDRLLAEHVVRNFSALKAPYFVTLHFGGTHAPYFVDPQKTPFVPWERTVAWSHMSPLHNAYRNSIYEQDESIAKCISRFLEAQGDSPWIIVFTSDHGEEFGEHHAIHHGQNLYDEQTHVPGFIAYGNGALEPEEEAQLRAREDDMVTHLDLLPTILDGYGVLDAMGMEPHRARFAGRSLLRAMPAEREPLPVTNCTEMFPCPLSTWGMLGTERLLVAQPWDSGFHCMHVQTGLEVAAGDGVCRKMVEASRAYFPELPNRTPNR
ncbi:sulfatase-like hydrolase/transferase [Pendulispora albinea]|uniref:Sulfatase-like hydrolase/transferase n=1 Tax=Pendulispora albinea TaxID=2741071 RepID=A0ABZ2LQN3_9BACT